MSRKLPLFYCLAKKYEPIFLQSLRLHLTRTMNPIDELFVVCDNAIDKESLASSISFDGKIHVLDDDQAWQLLGYVGAKYEKVRLDNRMRQQIIKINCDKITNRRYTLVVDVDSVPLTLTDYFQGDKFKLFHADPRTAIFDRLACHYFGNIDASYDFIVEKTIFDSEILINLRRFLGDSFLTFSYKRHTWYDITQDEYNVLAGPNWPRELQSWEELPAFVQEEIMQMITPVLIPTEWDEEWSEYQLYGYFSELYHKEKIVLMPCRVQNGPWGDGTADIFLNRSSERNSIDAFKYICNNLNTKYTY
jgi:hypothetical protein